MRGTDEECESTFESNDTESIERISRSDYQHLSRSKVYGGSRRYALRFNEGWTQAHIQ